jgi:hypothetical protein
MEREAKRRPAVAVERKVWMNKPVVRMDYVRALPLHDATEVEHSLGIGSGRGLRSLWAAVKASGSVEGTADCVDADAVGGVDGFRLPRPDGGHGHVVTTPNKLSAQILDDALLAPDDWSVVLGEH